MDMDRVRSLLESALTSFQHARACMAKSFSKLTAPEIVSAVLAGEMPRQGYCADGHEYFVHGIGYTVVYEGGAQVHVDGSRLGDSFSVYDIEFFLESGGSATIPTIAEISNACNDFVNEERLVMVEEGRYAWMS